VLPGEFGPTSQWNVFSRILRCCRVAREDHRRPTARAVNFTPRVYTYYNLLYEAITYKLGFEQIDTAANNVYVHYALAKTYMSRPCLHIIYIYIRFLI